MSENLIMYIYRLRKYFYFKNLTSLLLRIDLKLVKTQTEAYVIGLWLCPGLDIATTSYKKFELLLALQGLFFPISSKGSFICTIHQTGWHIPWPLLHQLHMMDQSDDPSQHEQTLHQSVTRIFLSTLL